MTWYSGVANALQNGTHFSQGNYTVSSYNASDKGWCSDVFYYGHKVFHYSHRPATHDDSFKYDFCGHIGYPKTTKVINCCLEAVNAKYRVKTSKGKAFEVQVSEKTVRYN